MKQGEPLYGVVYLDKIKHKMILITCALSLREIIYVHISGFGRGGWGVGGGGVNVDTDFALASFIQPYLHIHSSFV